MEGKRNLYCFSIWRRAQLDRIAILEQTEKVLQKLGPIFWYKDLHTADSGTPEDVNMLWVKQLNGMLI